MAPEATEHAQGPAVVRVIELVGVSNKSWSDAAQQAVERASETIRHITGLDVIHSTAVVRDRKIVEYHVNVKIAFVVEGTLVYPAPREAGRSTLPATGDHA